MSRTMASSPSCKDGEGEGKQWESIEEYPPDFLLPPLSNSNTKRGTAVLDLDGTLIHSTWDANAQHDFIVEVPRGNPELPPKPCFVSQRPLVEELLLQLVKSGFEIVVYTSSVRAYATQIVAHIDPHNTITHCLSRESCNRIGGVDMKELGLLGRDLERVVAVDDYPEVYGFHRCNVLPVRLYEGDKEGDTELANVIEFFAKLDPNWTIEFEIIWGQHCRAKASFQCKDCTPLWRQLVTVALFPGKHPLLFESDTSHYY